MPFITEELNGHLRERLQQARVEASCDPLTREAIAALHAPCCMVSPFPQSQIQPQEAWRFPSALEQMQTLREVIYRVRSLRAEMKVPTGSPTDLILEAGASDLELLRSHEYVFRSLLPLKNITVGMSDLAGKLAASSSFGTITLTVPLPLEMASADFERCKKQVLTLEQNIELLRSRLASESFVAKAPAELVEKQRLQLAEMEKELQALHGQIQKLKEMMA